MTIDLAAPPNAETKSLPRVTITYDDDYLEELRERLAEYGISQGELARETGIDRTQFSRWFHKKMLPRLDAVAKIELAIARIRARNSRKDPKSGR